VPGHVLIVDDQPDLLLLMRLALESAGYRVTAAADGPAALRAVAAEVPDVIVSDVMMPAMDGFTMVAQLRSDARLAGVPVVFLTAAGNIADVEARARPIGVEQCLRKPFNARALLGAVRSVLEPRPAA